MLMVRNIGIVIFHGGFTNDLTLSRVFTFSISDLACIFTPEYKRALFSYRKNWFQKGGPGKVTKPSPKSAKRKSAGGKGAKKPVKKARKDPSDEEEDEEEEDEESEEELDDEDDEEESGDGKTPKKSVIYLRKFRMADVGIDVYFCRHLQKRQSHRWMLKVSQIRTENSIYIFLRMICQRTSKMIQSYVSKDEKLF